MLWVSLSSFLLPRCVLLFMVASIIWWWFKLDRSLSNKHWLFSLNDVIMECCRYGNQNVLIWRVCISSYESYSWDIILCRVLYNQIVQVGGACIVPVFSNEIYQFLSAIKFLANILKFKSIITWKRHALFHMST